MSAPVIAGQVSVKCSPSSLGDLFGCTFDLVSRKSINYACVVKGDTPLTHVVTLL